MNKETAKEFLALVRMALHGEEDGKQIQEIRNWTEVLEFAQKQNMLPLVAGLVLSCPDAQAADPQSRLIWKRQVMQEVSVQVKRTHEFLNLMHEFRENGLDPIVVKGIVCRELYPEPDNRPSSDEDVLIEPEKWREYDRILQAHGFRNMDTKDPETAFEIGYAAPGSLLHIEIHKTLFNSESKVFDHFNPFFSCIREHKIAAPVFSVPCHTDHMLYLLLHAFKHFLHSGFGLRQVCDIALFAENFNQEINWPYIWQCCKASRSDGFAAALFQIGREKLDLGVRPEELPDEFAEKIRTTDAAPLLNDLLEAGIYGDSSLSRKHSSNITLHAAETQAASRTGIGFVAASVFLPFDSMKEKFPYLKRYPLLLPAAWGHRIIKYLLESQKKEDSTPAEALKIGQKRVHLLEQYGVFDNPEQCIRITGSSMAPFLCHERDFAYYIVPDRPLRKGDIVFYRRDDGRQILHRIAYKHGKEQQYDMIGDGQTGIEKGIRRDQIFGLVTHVDRKGRRIGPGHFWWWWFAVVWIRLIPLRGMINKKA